MTAHTHRTFIAGCRLCDTNPVTEARDDAKYHGEFSSRNRQWDAPERHEAEQDRQ